MLNILEENYLKIVKIYKASQQTLAVLGRKLLLRNFLIILMEML